MATYALSLTGNLPSKSVVGLISSWHLLLVQLQVVPGVVQQHRQEDDMALGSGSTATNFTEGDLGKPHSGGKCLVQRFRNLKDVGGDEGAYKDRGAGWLLLNCTDGLQSDNKKLRPINKKL